MKFLTIFYVVLLFASAILAKPPKNKRKKSAQASSASQHYQPGNVRSLKKFLNELITYDDGSLISEIDLKDNIITITNPYDNSILFIIVDDIQSISDEIANHLRFQYAERVASWFDDTAISTTTPKETVERHRFAQRVDEIIVLYGRPSHFTNNYGQLVENLTLPGIIVTEDGRSLEGTFEYAQSENSESSEPILYHRFFHPNSRAVPI